MESIMDVTTQPPPPGGLDHTTSRYKHDKDKKYYDLMAFVVSNAVAGEIMAVDNYSEMVPLMPDLATKAETVKQATEEAKHIKMLSSLGRRLDYNVEQRIVEPQWHAIRGHFSEAVRKTDLAACLIIQDLMTETMAIVLYTTLSRDTDADTSHVASTILQDELEHLDIGVNRLKRMLANDSASVHDSLVWAHHRVMPELFSMISTGCHSLCDVLNVECGSLTLDSIRTDIESIKLDALDAYMETLDRVGFASKVTSPLIASMSSYGVTPRADLRLRSDTGCRPESGCC